MKPVNRSRTLQSFLQDSAGAIGDASSAQQATILLVDDDPAVRRLTAQALEKEGYHLLLADDVGQAVEIAAHYDSPIHLLLTDVMLPSGNGIELARAVLAKRPHTPVLYMSGYHADDIRSVQDGSAPDGGFLEKPFLPQAVVTRVREMIGTDAEGTELALGDQPASPDPTASLSQSEATYRLERAVRCSQCGETVSTLNAVRLLRTQVNFTSTLPRRGRVLVCPNCQTMVPAELTNL
jgi:DNA-binding NtrC family response regulator